MLLQPTMMPSEEGRMESGKEGGREVELQLQSVLKSKKPFQNLHFFTLHALSHTHTHTHITPTPPPTHSFTSCVTHLLRNFTGATPFTPDSSGFTPLHYAALYGHKMAVQMASHCKAATCDGYKIIILQCFCYV